MSRLVQFNRSGIFLIYISECPVEHLNEPSRYIFLESMFILFQRTVSRSSDTRCDVTDIDDVSDSGVMSLPTSDDEPMDFGLVTPF